MKYWKEKDPLEEMEFWSGTRITKLAENEIFLYGSNPQGINGAGAAKAAMSLSKGAKNGIGRGFNGDNAYALVTKSLNAGFLEKSTGILYDKEGYRSVSPEQIRKNIDELYEVAKSSEHKNKKFLISYKYESWSNGTPKKSLNGYTSQEILEMFAKDKDIPKNIVFHESYRHHLIKLYKNKQNLEKTSIFNNGKSVDIKEENIVWIIDEDERNPEGRHGAGAAKLAVSFGAKYGLGRGLSGQTYALITKNLKPGYFEKSTGITYETEGYRSVSLEQIIKNVQDLYECAKTNPTLDFIITYKYDVWPNGSLKKSLNGYNAEDMISIFSTAGNIPDNIIFHESYRKRLNEVLTVNNNQEQRYNYLDNYKEKGFLFFWHSTSPFSQWHPAKFSVKGSNGEEITFSSAEQFMMYCKAKLFKDEEVAEKILSFNTNGSIANKFLNGEITRDEILKNGENKNNWDLIQKKIKSLGREVKNYNEELWVKNRVKFVSRGNLEKFSQNEDLKTILLSCKDLILVEANPYDKIWAIGLRESDPKAKDPSLWNGKNLLGKIHTHLKRKFQSELENELKKTDIKNTTIRPKI